MTIDATILNVLRTAEAGISGADLATQLGVTRAAVWARIKDLRTLGYEIDASPHLGYRLRRSPNLLHSDDLRSRLQAGAVIGREVEVFQETTSTNDVVQKLAIDGVREGVVVFAESQTRGRGRLGRSWHSPAGKGLWFSVLLRPRVSSLEVTHITITVAVSIRRAIEAVTRLPAEIKWPNDILVEGRKVAGILTEVQAEQDAIRYVIVGVGTDVNQAANDFPKELRGVATSLRQESGREVHRADLAAAMLQALDEDYGTLQRGDFGALAEVWERACTTIGSKVTIQVGGRRVQGTAESLDADGALLIRTRYGRLERVVGGDVTVER